MPSRISRDRSDGRFAGVAVVSSPPGEWVAVAVGDFISIGAASSIPASAQVLDLFITETGGENPAYLLLRAHNSGTPEDPAETGWRVEAGSSRAFACYLPDSPVQVISLYGSARIDGLFV